jgi:hypothetical protein
MASSEGGDKMQQNATLRVFTLCCGELHINALLGDCRMRNAAALGIGVVLLAWAGAAAGATTWIVDAAGGGDYTSIQAAIDAAQSGEEIAVVPGTYLEAIDFKGKAVRLYGTAGADSTTIDGTGHPHVVQCINGEGPGTILEGFKITGGNAEGYIDSCGGGLFSDNSSPTVTRCSFVGNIARYGGGICGDALVSECLFSNNSAQTGGGMWRVNSVSRSTFIGNAASMGAAIHSSQTVSDCAFIDNEEGIFEAGDVMNCTFTGTLGGSALTNARTVTNCRFINNQHNAMVTRLDYQTIVTQCTFLNNEIGITNAQDGMTTLVNSIIRGNTIAAIQGPATVSYSNIEGGWSGEGNIDSDPLFADSEGRLATGSPCIDTATNSPPGGLPATDIEGNVRPLDGNGDGQAVADMGAWEHPAVPVQVLDPVQLLANLKGSLDGMNFPNWIEYPLMAKLKQAEKALEKPQPKNRAKAADALKSFRCGVEAQRGKGIAGAQADTLVAAANQIINLLCDR